MYNRDELILSVKKISLNKCNTIITINRSHEQSVEAADDQFFALILSKKLGNSKIATYVLILIIF